MLTFETYFLQQNSILTSDSPVKDHITYVSSLEKRLKLAYKTAAKVAEKASKRHKTPYDLRGRHSNLQKGDRVLLKKVGFKGSFWLRRSMLSNNLLSRKR
jgi:hypothetical protein